MNITKIKYCDATGKMTRVQLGEAPPIPPMPSLTGLLEKIGKFKKANPTPKKPRSLGERYCKCGCGAAFCKSDMVYMGRPESKQRDYLFGPSCAKRWISEGRGLPKIKAKTNKQKMGVR